MNHYTISSLLTILSTLFLTLFVYLNRKSAVNRKYALYSLSVAVWSFAYLKMITSSDRIEGLFWSRALHLGAIFIPMLFLHFTIVLLDISRQKRNILVFNYAICFMLLMLCFTPLFVLDAAPKFAFKYFVVPGVLYHLFTIFFVACVSYTLYLLYKGFKNVQGTKRNQLKYVFFAYLIGYSGGVTAFLPLFNIPTPPGALYTIPLCMTIITYAIIKHRLMDIKVAVTRAGIFLLIYTLILGLPFHLGYLTKSWILSTSLAIVFATIGPFIYRSLHRKAEELLLAEQRRYQTLLLKGGEGMIRQHQLDKLLKWITSVVKETIGIRYAALFLDDKEKQLFVLKIKEDNGEIPEGLVFSYRHPFIIYIESKKEPFLYEELPQPIRDCLNLPFEISLVIPSFTEGNHLGFLILGEKLNQQFYSPDDLNVFKIFSHQAGLAIENAKLYGEVQKETKALKETLKELKETQSQLIQAEKMHIVGRLSSGVAHEIKNPLGIIIQGINYLEEVIGADKGKKQVEVLSTIKEAVGRADRIIRGLLDFSRIAPLEFKPCDIHKIIETSLNLVAKQLTMGNIKITQDFRSEFSLINANENQIQQALINIILNSLQAMSKGDELIIRTYAKGFTELKDGLGRSVKDFFQPGDTAIICEIEDTGTGISKENIGKVFDPFFTTKPPGEGVGLGLSITKSIIDSHKGLVNIESEEGKGTKVTLTLPIFKQI